GERRSRGGGAAVPPGDGGNPCLRARHGARDTEPVVTRFVHAGFYRRTTIIKYGPPMSSRLRFVAAGWDEPESCFSRGRKPNAPEGCRRLACRRNAHGALRRGVARARHRVDRNGPAAVPSLLL